MEMQGKASVHIDAEPDAVYELISDITRMGEWSPECQGGDWIDGATPSVGSQFHGRNRRGDNEWTTPNTVIAAKPAESSLGWSAHRISKCARGAFH